MNHPDLLHNQPAGLEQNVDLTPFVTLRTPAKARYYLAVHQVEQLTAGLMFAREQGLPYLVLGGGSNLVLKADFDGLVLHICLKGVAFDALSESDCILTAAAGENWHELVRATVAQGYRGLENLALIPGTVGAAPVQNIGAYGVEVKDTLLSLDVLDTRDGSLQTLTVADCQFGYRHSLFKTQAGQPYVILSVRFALSKTRAHQLGYAELAQAFAGREAGVTTEEIMELVIRVRQAKLPDPAQVPNAGSFFKNPVVDCRQFEALQAQFPEIAHYPLADGSYKLAAAWLIDQAGWRGFRDGAVGVHERQALVLINPGQGSGDQVLQLAGRIRASVLERYGVELEMEPVVV